MKRLLTYLLFSGLFLLNRLAAQETINHKFLLSWSPEDSLSFEGAGEFSQDAVLPVYTYRFPVAYRAEISVNVMPDNIDFIHISDPNLAAKIPSDFIVGATIEQERNKYFARVWLMPLISVNGDKAARIVQGTLNIQIAPREAGIGGRSGPEFKESSELANGIIHRVSVDQPGIYKLDYTYVKDKLKIDPSTIDPTRIGVFSNGGGRVPQWNAAPRIDDLEQSATLGYGLDDGQFNQGDYLLWYAQGPHSWAFDPAERIYNMELNNYDEVNHYYIILNGQARKAIESRPNGTGGNYMAEKSMDFQRMEDEKVNLLGRYRPPGSGQEWYGDEMAVVKELDYTNRFDVRDLIAEDTLNYKVRFAGRSSNLTRFYLRINQKEASRNVGGVDLGNYESSFANDALLQGEFIPGSPIEQISIRYPDANGINSRGWVDYIQLNFWKRNVYRQGSPLLVRDPRASFAGTPIYTVEGATASCQVWDITEALNPVIQLYATGEKTTFVKPYSGGVPDEFILFNPATDVRTPQYEREVANQNLHNIQRADLAIVYYDQFADAALKLAEHRRSYSGLEVVALPASQVFEEFGGGSMDPSAIRDFARMLYKRDPHFQYLCLMGDASYDYLNHFAELPYQNFIPAFETEESLDPIRSFPSDDFYALLDDDEGDNLIGAIDIAVGRLPVSTADEALKIVDKIMYYDKNTATLNDWRSRVVMVADDEDGNIHLNQADGLAVQNVLQNPDLNMQKIYLDAFPQESTPGGDRYPTVNEAIDLNMKKGALTVTYMGHGGQNGWTQERVLGINQAQSYDNLDNMPLFITATCSFAGYDEPGFISAGEHLLLNPGGGAVALMTTVRAVYSGSNERLTRAVLNLLYVEDSPGIYPSIAEVLRRAKNVNAIDTLDNNARKFTLLGDPSQKLAIPQFDIVVTQIGDIPVSTGILDTLSALEKTVVSGQIIGHQGEVLTDFNGKLFLTLFDKVQTRKTLANDEASSERVFTTQNRQIFKGTATVTAGEWTIEFALPKDIDFSFGHGKMSLYAHNDITDASGYFTEFIVGGVSTDGLTDDQPPVVKLFMNDNNFLFGGMTDPNPDIYIQLSDDNGINVSGTSVGHDIEAVLDGDDRNSLILNDFYQAALNDYTSGEVRYPLTGLAPGLHTLRVTAWDLANNPGEAYLEFVVVDKEGPIIQNLFNYPNPFSSLTYFQFEHNRPGVAMDIDLSIYDLAGRLVKNISRVNYVSDGYRVNDIDWDGLDNQRGEVIPGIYVYKLNIVFTNNGTKEVVESNAEKLVIIR
jgi:hypothetical protein